ncbi:MAG: class I SAM-dependent rRNA methyltransferase, partial [Deinococcus sp.]
VLKLYTAAWFPWLPTVLPLLGERFPGFAVVLRLSRNVQGAARLQGLADGDVLAGEAPPGPVVFRESGLRFEADVRRGQKTGFFLDQRDNRRRVEGLSRGRRVMNAFSFSGGFSLYAARGGAASVLSLDLSRHALEAVDRNFVLNPKLGAVPQRGEQADVFSWLGTAQERLGRERFGLIVLDPPSLARRESERAGAIRAYTRLAADALRLLEPGGVLVSASCSAHVSADEFYQAMRSAVRGSGRRAEELALTGHAPDHPASFPEAQYLKAMFLRVG